MFHERVKMCFFLVRGLFALELGQAFWLTSSQALFLFQPLLHVQMRRKQESRSPPFFSVSMAVLKWGSVDLRISPTMLVEEASGMAVKNEYDWQWRCTRSVLPSLVGLNYWEGKGKNGVKEKVNVGTLNRRTVQLGRFYSVQSLRYASVFW